MCMLGTLCFNKGANEELDRVRKEALYQCSDAVFYGKYAPREDKSYLAYLVETSNLSEKLKNDILGALR